MACGSRSEYRKHPFAFAPQLSSQTCTPPSDHPGTLFHARYPIQFYNPARAHRSIRQHVLLAVRPVTLFGIQASGTVPSSPLSRLKSSQSLGTNPEYLCLKWAPLRYSKEEEDL